MLTPTSSLTPEAITLRRKLTSIARKLRHTNLPETISYTQPQSVSASRVRFNGTQLTNKRIVMLTASCSVASCTMCHLPNEALWQDRPLPTNQQLLAQFDAAFETDQISDYELITIYNNGNFFSDREVPPAVRVAIAERVRAAGAKYLLVESLPQFMTDQALLEMTTALGQTKLVLSIGLQSANDYIREVAINSTCTKAQFERVVRFAQQHGHHVMTFVMLKPPFLTEREGIEDAVETVAYLTQLGVTEIALCPTQVSSSTIVDLLYQAEAFQPPKLWSVVEVLKQLQERRLNFPRIATSVLRVGEHDPQRFCRNCERCSDTFIRSLEQFNTTRELEPLLVIACECADEYQTVLDTKLETPIPDRVTSFVKNHFLN